MLLDDHEIANDWEPVSDPDDAGNASLRDGGVSGYQKYQRGLSPPIAPSQTFAFRSGGYAFFMLDTRSARRHRRNDKLGNANLLVDAATMASLQAFLMATNGPKFVVSPAMLLPRHRCAAEHNQPLDAPSSRALHSGGWDGDPVSLMNVLAAICRPGIERVVFLSGDEHLGCIAQIDITDQGSNHTTRVYSIHTPGAYTPFPFVNSRIEDFHDQETFTFASGGNNYSCSYTSEFATTGNSMTYLRPRPDPLNPPAWLLDCELADGTIRTLAI
jgi:phosphodiesterase/alkaline phosphatase D-like protein